MSETKKEYTLEEIIKDIGFVTAAILVRSENIKIYLDIANDKQTSVSSKELYKSRARWASDMIDERQSRLKELVEEIKKHVPIEEF